jgi:biofilm PGA synthesis N-glycosyltransferase PgaC
MTKYVVITAARDEGRYIESTIHALLHQTIVPQQWIIVNDGSSDDTGEIVERYAKRYPWVTTVHLPNRGFRKAGGGVIEAFNAAYMNIRSSSWDFLVKLDADLSFAPDYFQRCFAEFKKDAQLGIAGGGIYHRELGELVLEPGPLFHVRGATKVYKRECWDTLGGLLPAPGWDTIDEVKANMLGWSTRTFPELQLVHHKFTGSADGSWKDSVKNGFANYVTGYHPLFMLFKCMRRLTVAPRITGAAGLAWGFIKGYTVRAPRVPDSALIAYTRSQQMRRLLLMDSIWK